MAGCIPVTILCRILGLFFIFLRFVSSYACELQFDWKTLSSIFFRRFVFCIREIMYANNCVFHCVHKQIDNAFSPGDNYSFREWLQITLRLLSSKFRKHSSFAYVISRIQNTNRQKKTWTMFFNQIAVHTQNFWQIWEKSNSVQHVKWHISTFNNTWYTVQHLLNNSSNICWTVYHWL